MTLYRVIGFHTTSDALAFSSACSKRDIPGRLMSIPRQMSAGCGLAWRIPLEQAADLETLLQDAALAIEVIKDIEL